MLDLNIHHANNQNNNSQLTSEEYLRANSSHLLTFFRRHSQETEASTILSGLKERVVALNESSSSSESFITTDPVTPPPFYRQNFVQVIRNAFPCKKEQIADSILLGKFENVSNYFYKHPKMIFVYSQLLLTHAELGTLPKDELLKILVRVASALNEKDHKKKFPSILETFKTVISIDSQTLYSEEHVSDLIGLFKQDQRAVPYPREFAKEMGRCLFVNLLNQIAKLDGDVSASLEHELLKQLHCHCSYFNEKKMMDSLPLLKMILEKPGGVIIVSDVIDMKDLTSHKGVFHDKSLTNDYFELLIQISKKDQGVKILTEWFKQESKSKMSVLYFSYFINQFETHCDWFAELMATDDGKSLCYFFVSSYLLLKNSNSFLSEMTSRIGGVPGGFEVLKRYIGPNILKEFKKKNPTLFSHVMSLKNPNGTRFAEYYLYQLSSSWLEKVKVQKRSSLDETQYKENLLQAKADVQNLMRGIDFGDSADPVLREISTIRYTKSSVDVTETLSKKTVKNALDQFFKKLEGSQDWDEMSKESQFDFAAFLLVRLLPVIFTLKERNDPKLTAGVLMALAKLEVSGKCSSAYPPEIEQLLHLYGTSSKGKTGLSFEDIIEREVQSYLEGLIDKILKKKFNQVNVHYRNYYLHCIGLYPFNERAIEKLITKLTVLWDIKENFDFMVLIEGVETHLKDQIRLHSFETIPSDYNFELLNKIDRAKRLEGDLETKIVERLRKFLPDETLVNQLKSEFFCWRSPCIDPRLRDIPSSELKASIRNLAKEAFLKIVPDEAMWIQLNLLLSEATRDDVEQQVQTLIKMIDPVLPADTQDVVLKKLNVMRQINSIIQVLKSQEGVIQRFERMISANKGFEPFKDHILSELIEFTNHIKQIADELEAHYDFKEYLLPSTALEYQRREDYLEQHPKKGQQLIIQQLLKMGVLDWDVEIYTS